MSIMWHDDNEAFLTGVWVCWRTLPQLTCSLSITVKSMEHVNAINE